MAGADVSLARLPARALLIQARWLEPIFSGNKTWEVRGKNLHVRGRACLANGGYLVGEVEFTAAHPIGARDEGNTLVAVPGHEHHFIGLRQNQDKTCVEDVSIFTYSRLFGCTAPMCCTARITHRTDCLLVTVHATALGFAAAFLLRTQGMAANQTDRGQGQGQMTSEDSRYHADTMIL